MKGKVLQIEPCVICHGGAGTIPQSREPGKLRGVRKAANIGYEKLMDTDSPIKAVEAAVRYMEYDEYFNAGYGSVLTTDGTVEMDASIMCGRTLNFGCVSLVKDILHPITLAKLVMQRSRSKFLGEDAAIKFARENGMRILYPPGQLVTDFTSNVIQNFIKDETYKQKNRRKEDLVHEAVGETGTVGAVAIDQFGNLAVATSTGGIGGKMPGRIGDTPVLGCGTYCDNKFGGISTTGHGDILMRACLAYDVIKRMDYLEENIQTASDNACQKMLKDFKGTGGLVGLDSKGNISISFTSQRMAWGYRRGDHIHYGIKEKEHFVKDSNDESDGSEGEEEEEE
jgi:L-asparaginase / beta-aspartyl-peptidase